MRRGSIVQLVVIGLISGAIATCIALFVPWMPTTATSRRSGSISRTGSRPGSRCSCSRSSRAILIYALINFRAEPGDWSDGPPIHGHTMLEVIWTIVPTILVIAICIVSAVVLAKNSDAGDNPVEINVVAQQFAWAFSYDDGKTFYPTMRVPIDRDVKLTLTANDVIHSFWVPQFAQKQDAVPGVEQTLVITPTKLGTFPVICTELCGLGHSLMRSEATVMTQAEFDEWREQAAAPPADGDGKVDENSGEAVFVNNGCGACHTLSSIDSAKGTIGPSLDNLSKEAANDGMSLEDFIRESIVDPAASTPEGYNPGTMPPFAQIPPEQLDALVQYLAENTN